MKRSFETPFDDSLFVDNNGDSAGDLETPSGVDQDGDSGMGELSTGASGMDEDSMEELGEHGLDNGAFDGDLEDGFWDDVDVESFDDDMLLDEIAPDIARKPAHPWRDEDPFGFMDEDEDDLGGSVPTPRGIGTRTLGIDFGLRRVGVALSSGYAPVPLDIIGMKRADYPSFIRVARNVANIVERERVKQVVVGMPYKANGEEGKQAAVTRIFANILADAVAPRPVFFWDETLSTAKAEVTMHDGAGALPGERIDSHAAAVILGNFFVVKDKERRTAPYVAPKHSR